MAVIGETIEPDIDTVIELQVRSARWHPADHLHALRRYSVLHKQAVEVCLGGRIGELARLHNEARLGQCVQDARPQGDDLGVDLGRVVE